MAHVRLLNFERTPTPIYLVDAAVGRGQSNRRDDVLLVQFFLRSLAAVKPAGTGDAYQVPGAPPLAVDGVFGPQTGAAITRFQKVLSALENMDVYRMQQDGAVYPVGEFRATNSPMLTIVRINGQYRSAVGDSNFFSLTNDPLFPRELKSKFYYG